MTFIPGGSNGSVSTSQDVALNTIGDGQVLYYEGTIQKWTNGTIPGDASVLQAVNIYDQSTSSYGPRVAGYGSVKWIGPVNPGPFAFNGDIWINTSVVVEEPVDPPTDEVFPLRASSNNRYLETASGNPFLYIADTAWMASVKLTREEWIVLLDTRASQGFNTIQVILPGMRRESSSQYDATLGYTNRYGKRALNSMNFASPSEVGARTHDATSPDYDFWDHVDWMIDVAAERGIQLNLSPAWYGYGGEDWRGYVTNENATAYGTFVGQRLGHKKNIMWMLGGDNNPGNDIANVPSGLDTSDKTTATNNMGNAIRVAEAVPHLMSYHAKRLSSSNAFFPSQPWHTVAFSYANERTYQYVAADYNRTSDIKPIIMPEAYYDGFNANNNILDNRRLRTQAYWTFLSGGVGYAYGHRDIWTIRDSWQTSMNATSAFDMKRMSALLSEFNHNKLVPDHRTGNSTKMLTSGYGSSSDTTYAVSARSSDNAYGLTYFPTNRSDIVVNMSALGGGSVALIWFNPSNGEKTTVGTFSGSGTKSLSWPSNFTDAVLIAKKS